MAARLLPASRGLAPSAGNPVSRYGVATLAVFRFSDRTESISASIRNPEGAGALGVADRRSLRGRGLDCSPTHADAWYVARGRIGMRPVAVGVLFTWVLLETWCTLADADGGSLRLSGTQSGYRITVFTAPTPFRAGWVDISVLVQDSLTGEPMTGARVTVRMSKLGQLPLDYPATAEAATNKLFRAAQFELPEPGRWDMQVRVEGSHGPAVIAGEVEAAKPLPRRRVDGKAGGKAGQVRYWQYGRESGTGQAEKS